MDTIAVWVGKLTLATLRLLGRRGNALPGLVVEKLFPRFLPRMAARLPQGVVIVSGTNGKTTTTKMVATVLGRRWRVLTNDTGSNFVRGAITAIVQNASWRAVLDADVAVFELDEAWAVRFVDQVAPRRVLLLNVMRDQLDRFGEIDATAQLLGRVAAAATEHVVLNRDDERIAALAARVQADVRYYGVAANLRGLFPNDEELYGGAVFISQQHADAELLELPATSDAAVLIRIGDSERRVALRAAGAHNAQNATGAAALALTFGMTADEIVDGLAAVSAAFGRGQEFSIDGHRLVLHLVKNPAGFRQNLRGVEGSAADVAVIAINDDYADGRDVSWLWDVDFSPLAARSLRLLTSGVRAADMAVRLHYDDVPVEDVEPDVDKAIRRALDMSGAGGEVAVFSTYTAMWALHAMLVRMAQRS